MGSSSCPLTFWSRDKLKILKLHYLNTYDHKTWQDGDLRYAASTHKVTWPYNHVVLWDLVQTKNIISLIPQCLWLSNFTGWGYTTRSVLPSSQEALWSRDLARSREILYLLHHLLPQGPIPLNLARWGLLWVFVWDHVINSQCLLLPN